MSRSIASIQISMNQAVQASPVLAPLLSSTSQMAGWNLFTYIVAAAINLTEQLQDIFKTQLDAEIALQPPGTPQWVVDEMLAFQYSETNPQVVQFTNGVPAYPVINPSLQIISHAAAVTSPSAAGQVLVKLAGPDPTTPLTSQVSTLTIFSPGSGYTSPPTVTLIGGGQPYQLASFTMPAPPYSTGQVIQVTVPGAGYTFPPTAVFSGGGGTIQATGFVQLASQLGAAQAYIDTIGFAGITYNCVSYPADQMTVTGLVQYSGQYTQSVVSTSVQTAINAYLASLPFNGNVVLSDLFVTIKAVPGVIDLELTEVSLLTMGNPQTTNYLVSIDTDGNSYTSAPFVQTYAGSAVFQVDNIVYTTQPL